MAFSRDLTTTLVVAAWYFTNIAVILLNKYVLSFYHFKYPIFLTFCHMVTCMVCSQVTIILKFVKPSEVKSSAHMSKISCLAVVFVGSVVLGNVSLRYLPVSFNQAIGATTPVFTAALSFLVMGVVESTNTYLALVPVVIGIVIASGFEPSFHMIGFVACLCGTCSRALKSVMQALLLSNADEKMDSINLLRYMAPVACVVLLPLSLILEDEPYNKALAIAAEFPAFYVALGINCLLAFFVNLLNFLVTNYTGALTLQVLGNAKGVVAVGISLLLFQNPVSYMALFGYCITVCGVIAYSEAKKAARASSDPSTQEKMLISPEKPDFKV